MRLLLAALAALLAAPTASSVQPKDVYGSCAGVGHADPTGSVLACENDNCDSGCILASVITEQGPAYYCRCAYIGPMPDCCRVIFYPATKTLGVTGYCQPDLCNELPGGCFELDEGDGWIHTFCGTFADWLMIN